MLIFRDKNNAEIERGDEVEYKGKKFIVEVRSGGQLRTYNFDPNYEEHLLRNVNTEKDCLITNKNPMSDRCVTCEHKIKPESEVYKDGYFGQINCSWDCAIEYMSDFFGLAKGETEKLKNIR